MKRIPKTHGFLAVTYLAAISFVATLSSNAQIIYSNDLNSDPGTNWVVLNGSVAPPTTNRVNFMFDYSKVGIPVAPHTTDGTTIGLQLSADLPPSKALGTVTGAGLSVSPTNFSITANFDMHVDMWVNFNGVNVLTGTPYTVPTTNGGGSGSSMFYGCGYGTAGTAAQIAGTADSVYVGTCTDNGSSAEFRMYGPNQTGSYQSGVYQISGTSVPDPGGDNFVYNTTGGTRTFANLSPWNTYFPSVQPPATESALFPGQTNLFQLAGLPDFAWHDVEIQKIGNVIVYSIDSHIVATANSSSAGVVAGGYLTFLAFDINGNATTDNNWTNVNYVLFDNIRVFNYANVVTVQATQPNASEIGLTHGTFTISRTSAGVPLTINYTLSGTATNGVQYQTLPGSVTFSSTATTTNITVIPIDDGIPNLPTTVILTIASSPNYTGAGSDTVHITDGDATTVDISSPQAQAYERYTNGDFISYQLSRRGNVTSSSTITLNYAGTAIAGTDYVATNNIFIPAGVNITNFQVFPIRNPAVTGNRTVTVTVASGAAVGTATNNTATIVDSDYITSALILTNALSDPNDVTNWSVVYGTGDPVGHATDFSADFGFNLGNADTAPVPPPPGGSATALHMTCNKNSGPPGPGAPGGVNAYYTNQVFGGNYAVRFNMNLIEGESALSSGAGEGALFGINHTGSCSNWWYSGGTNSGTTYASDGEWYFVSSQYGGTLNGDYQSFTGLGGTNNNTGWTRLAAEVAPDFTSVFKSNPGPFSSVDDALKQSGGMPANGAPGFGYNASTWSDVEIKQLNNLITLSINHTKIFSYTNSTVWTNGYLMLGYADPLGASVETADAGVYYANLEVVKLTAPTVSATTVTGTNLTLTFSSPDSTATFVLQSAAVVSGPYTDVSPAAAVIPVSAGQYQVATPEVGAQEFYRLRYK